MITERILQVIEKKEITKYKFCKDLGLSNSFLDKSREITTDKYANILEYFPDINPKWLLTGKGSMFKPIGLMSEEEIAEQDAEVAAGKVQEYTYKSTQLKPIPLVFQNAVAGFGSNDFTINEADVKDYYIIPKFKYNKIDFMIEISGASMYPKYNSGDVVACTIIKESQFIQWNKCHVIATREQGILVKRLKPAEKKGFITAISDNKDYPPFDIPLNEVTGMALVVGVIRLE